MRGEGDVGADGAAAVREAHRVAPAEAVARDGDLGRVEGGPRVADGGLDERVGDVGAVRGEEGRAVVGRVVDVRGRRLAGEQVGRHGQEAGAGEGVGEAGGGC